jgi:hypothetical protein
MIRSRRTERATDRLHRNTATRITHDTPDTPWPARDSPSRPPGNAGGGRLPTPSQPPSPSDRPAPFPGASRGRPPPRLWGYLPPTRGHTRPLAAVVAERGAHHPTRLRSTLAEQWGPTPHHPVSRTFLRRRGTHHPRPSRPAPTRGSIPPLRTRSRRPRLQAVPAGSHPQSASPRRPDEVAGTRPQHR